MKKIVSGKNNIILTVLFIVSYFYLRNTLLSKTIILLSIGIFMAICAYCLYSKFSSFIKLISISVSCSLLIAIPFILDKRNESKLIEPRFLGIWKTDSTDGYTIRMNIKMDSAFLTQSSIDLERAFKLNINTEDFILTNETKTLSYKYHFLNANNTLILKNSKDSLLFTRNT